MSEAALRIWASLVKLAGTGQRQAVPPGGEGAEEYQLPVPPGREGAQDSGRVPPVRPLLPPKSGEGQRSSLITRPASSFNSSVTGERVKDAGEAAGPWLQLVKFCVT